MNIWFTRFVLLAMALALLAMIFSIIPLENARQEPREGVVVSPATPPTNGEITPSDDLE